MRPLPTPPAPGKPVSATLIRQLIDAIRERTILPGRNTTVKIGPNGTTVNSAETSSAGPSSSSLRYWVYVPAPEPDEGSEEEPPKAKWTNCVVQLGFRAGLKLNDFELEDDEDGEGVYALEVDLRTASTAGSGFAIKRYEDENHIPAPDIANDKVYVYIGKVEEKENSDGETELVQTDGIYSIPVIYKYV